MNCKIEELLMSGDINNIKIAYYLNNSNNIMSFYEFFILLLGCSLYWDGKTPWDGQSYAALQLNNFTFKFFMNSIYFKEVDHLTDLHSCKHDMYKLFIKNDILGTFISVLYSFQKLQEYIDEIEYEFITRLEL